MLQCALAGPRGHFNFKVDSCIDSEVSLLASIPVKVALASGVTSVSTVFRMKGLQNVVLEDLTSAISKLHHDSLHTPAVVATMTVCP